MLDKIKGKNMYKFKKAFTLAEVLITLLIIGVIASIVIPGVINDTKEAEFNVGVKKTYADLSNALKMVLINNGNVLDFANEPALRDDFCNVMTCVAKGRGIDVVPGGDAFYRYKNKAVIEGDFNYSNNIVAKLNNGTLFLILPVDSTCAVWGVNVCAKIQIDINGLKGPAMAGKDVYMFYIVRNNGAYSILPAGTDNDTAFQNWACSISTNNGEACTARRLYNPDSMP